MDIISLLPSFGNLAFTLGAFVVALLIIVAVHEYGHYIVGRWCGIHAETFSLGFGPVLARRTDRRGTQWQIAALPLGGYVKFLGDGNAASMGQAEVSAPERRRTMMGAPLWARAATVAAGPIFNFIFSVLIFFAVFMVEGRVSDDTVVGAVPDLPQGWVQELRPGDQILRIAGQDAATPAAFSAAAEVVPAGGDVPYVVLRDGQEVALRAPHPRPPIVRSVSPRSAAARAGVEPGDVIIAVDGAPVTAFAQLQQHVKEAQGAALDLRIWRAGGELSLELRAKPTDLPLPEGGFETRWLIGVMGGALFEPQTVALSPWDAARGALAQLWRVLSSSLSGLAHMITGAISSCNLSSPIGIAETSGAMASQGAMSFVFFLAFLSAAIGLLNLFPIPVLDGGHLVFHAYEALRGKPPSERVLQFAMALGLALISSVMILALLNDLVLCP